MILDGIHRFWQEIVARPNGPMALRIYLQPLVAAFLAFRDAHWDATHLKPAYGWAVVSSAEHRRALLRDGWRSIGKVFIIAFVLDTLYQLIVLRGLHPLQGVFVATGLALVPYLLLRGPLNRLMQLRRKRHGPGMRGQQQGRRPPRAA